MPNERRDERHREQPLRGERPEDRSAQQGSDRERRQDDPDRHPERRQARGEL